jgi:hypothetical protein
MKQPSSITSLPVSPDAERRSRVIKYTVTMVIRVLCVVAMLFARGAWLWIFAAGAIVLPYIAVVIANVGSNPNRRPVLRPEPLALPSGPVHPLDPSGSDDGSGDDRRTYRAPGSSE